MQSSLFEEFGLDANFLESFYTRSSANVLRGMHLQLPPADGAKLVYCLEGAILDVALDLRPDSPTFGQTAVVELSRDRHSAAYVPTGLAHGFLVRSGPALVMYHVTSEYHPELDSGVRWDSFGFDWPCLEPLISPRDAALPQFSEFRAFSNSMTLADSRSES